MSDPAAPVAKPVKLLDQVRVAIRLRHFSRRTEQAYTSWIRRFIVYHGTRHPRELGGPEVTAFLYGAVLGVRLPWMDDIVRAQRPARLPVVLSREEVALLLSRLRGPVWLMACLMYGAGLRLLECVELRVKDVNVDRGELTIRDGKGGKDRVTLLPAAMRAPLEAHLARTKRQGSSGGIICTSRSCSEP
ncbi:MAG: phage integrase N-terminal SAM-like domain-containing protein [Acidobacteria bacterium]|nr:phage integrase N-terminal SAM-like domain-containing protein [Acidobacteriota bacterium]